MELRDGRQRDLNKVTDSSLYIKENEECKNITGRSNYTLYGHKYQIVRYNCSWDLNFGQFTISVTCNEMSRDSSKYNFDTKLLRIPKVRK